MNAIDKMLMTYGVTVGRMLLGLLFVFSGLGLLVNGVDGIVMMMDYRGIPMASLLVWLVVILKIVAGTALILGWHTREAAMALIIFTGLATLLFHLSIEDIGLFKNLSIIGGLLYAYVYGPGDGWRLKTS